MAAYIPLTKQQQITVSGVLIPSGEALFADMVGQKPGSKTGINSVYNEESLKIIHKNKYIEPEPIICETKIYDLLTMWR
jgi:hypothetical protein